MSTEREREILKLLLSKKKATVKEISEMLYTSQSSVRRDLAKLEGQQLIKRVHGGAVIEENSTSSVKIPFALREMEQSDAKTEIAKQAAELIKDDDVLFLDASSSACALVPFIAVKKRITVITSGLQTMQKLGEYGVKVISTGGELIPSCRSLVGECAYKTIGAFNADAVFFSCRGISVDGYITDISEAENNVRRRMIARSDRSYLLCADKKVGKKFFHNLCTTKDITGVISNSPLPEFDF